MWQAGSNVSFKHDRLKKFLDELVTRVAPLGINVYVTSAYRSPKDQARVVCNNMVMTAGGNLSIYGPTTQDMYRTYCPHDMETLENYEQDKLTRAIASDPNHQGHGTGWAVDLRVKDLTNAKKLEYKAIIEEMGAEVLWETQPEHFHLWLRDWKPEKRKRNIGLASVAIVSVGIFVYAYLSRNKR